MSISDDRIEQEIFKSVSRGYEWLFATGQGKANWKLVAHTSLAGIALSYREPKNSPWILAIKKWLIDQQTELEPGIASWNESVSDTSFAILALLRMGVLPNDTVIRSGLGYLAKIFHFNGKPNWEDEPWETSWAILAIAASGDQEHLDEACLGAAWLVGIQDEQGMIIAPHYTSYFVKVCDTICKRQAQRGYCVIDEPKYHGKAEKAADCLLSTIDDKILWTGEPWSNGQILWALASTGHFPLDDQATVRKVVDWFEREQSPDGNWFDAEDTSCALIGLLALQEGLLRRSMEGQRNQEDAETIIYNHLRRLYEAPKLSLGKKLVEVQEDGTTSINLSPRALRTGALIFAAASGLTVVIALWDYIKTLFGLG